MTIKHEIATWIKLDVVNHRMTKLKKYKVTISDLDRKKEYDIEEETAWLAIQKAMNKFRDEFGERSIEVEIFCCQYVIGVASNET